MTVTVDTDPTRIDMSRDPLTLRFEGVAYHGNTPFSVPYISHIEGNLYQGGCETGLILPTNIEHLISLYPWEQYRVVHEIKSVLTVRMYDSTDQAFDQVYDIASWVASCMDQGPTLVHCQAGLNRSSLVAARALMLHDGLTGEEAINKIRESRSPACLCNRSFENWLRSLT